MNIHVAENTMSDDQVANERDAQWHLERLLQEVRYRIRSINSYSSVVQIDLTAWDNFVHDELPTKANWDEKISQARRP